MDGDDFFLSQAVYEGEEEYIQMERDVEDLFREERDAVQVMVGELEMPVEKQLESEDR